MQGNGTIIEERWATVLLSLALGLALLALLLALVQPLAPPPPDPAEVQRQIATDLVVDNDDVLRPEPLERFLFTSGILLLPFCLGGSFLLVRRLVSRAPDGALARPLEPAAAWLALAVGLGLLVSGGVAEGYQELRAVLAGGWYSLAVAVVLSVAASTAFVRGIAERAGRLTWFLSAGAAGVLLLGSLSISAFGEEHLRNVPIFWASFNAVFYSVVQVFQGRALTVDFINQYGMYPHLLEPVFRLVGLSVFSFTLVMGLLNCLTFACLYVFLARETRSALVSALGVATVFFLCYGAGKAVAQPDHYFQYHPLRMLFPALLLVLGREFAHRPRAWMAAALGALGAVAFLCTTDAGIVVLISALLVIGHDCLARGRVRELPWRLIHGTAAAAAVLALFALYLRFRYGAFPDYARLLLYPQAFYVYGYYMLPMPRFGLWVPVVVLYALGLLRGLVPLLGGEDRPRQRLFFLLAVLGLGLLSYYQGRSHVGNLLGPAYPAVLLLCLFADDLRRLPAPARSPQRVIGVTLLAALFFSLPALAAIAPAWVRSVRGKIEVSRRREATDILRDARFLQGFLRPGEPVVMMSFSAGLHHLRTGTYNPLDIPGDSELVYRGDLEAQSAYVLGRRGKAVVDRTTMSPRFIELIRARFQDRIENPHGTLIYLPWPRGAPAR